MNHYIAVESSSGRLIYVRAVDRESAYKEIGIRLFDMDPVDLDTGNVDVDMRQLPGKSTGQTPMAEYVTPEE